MNSFRSCLGLSAGVMCAAALLVNGATPDSPNADQQARYRVIDMGALPWVSDDVAAHINAAGEVSWWQVTADGAMHALTWTKGALDDIGTLDGFVSSISSNLNARGEAVGWAVSGKNLVDSLATTHAFVYSHSRMIDLSTLGGRDSKAMSINDSGQVVGWSRVSDVSTHAFRYQRNKLEDLGALPGGTYSTASAINSSGVIVGTAETAGHLVHAVVWSEKGLRDLGTLEGGMRSRALALNDQGDVVGFSEAEGGDTHGFLYKNGRMLDLGSLGKEPVRANSINNHGQIVGASNVTVYVRHAFLWEDGKMQDLNKLIAQEEKWRLVEAYDINDAGQIVCRAVSAGPSMARHLLLLEPITANEPVTISARK
jgi:probable HAF family extracellular repeat protein